MTDTRRDFLRRFAATAFAAAGAGCDSPVETADGPLGRREQMAVYGPPPGRREPEVRPIRPDYAYEIFFADGRLDLSPEAKVGLDRQIGVLTGREGAIVVEGHCDDRGSREYNLALGERRAEAVKQYLVRQGVPADRITTMSYGKERPRDLGKTQQARALNRRAVIRFEGK